MIAMIMMDVAEDRAMSSVFYLTKRPVSSRLGLTQAVPLIGSQVSRPGRCYRHGKIRKLQNSPREVDVAISRPDLVVSDLSRLFPPA